MNFTSIGLTFPGTGLPTLGDLEIVQGWRSTFSWAASSSTKESVSSPSDSVYAGLVILRSLRRVYSVSSARAFWCEVARCPIVLSALASSVLRADISSFGAFVAPIYCKRKLPIYITPFVNGYDGGVFEFVPKVRFVTVPIVFSNH